jgi:hypothetical protein
MPKSRGRKPKKRRAPTKGAPKQLIAPNTPAREPPIPVQTVPPTDCVTFDPYDRVAPHYFVNINA